MSYYELFKDHFGERMAREYEDDIDGFVSAILSAQPVQPSTTAPVDMSTPSTHADNVSKKAESVNMSAVREWPPLPEPFTIDYDEIDKEDTPCYSADQMLAYAQLCIASNAAPVNNEEALRKALWDIASSPDLSRSMCAVIAQAALDKPANEVKVDVSKWILTHNGKTVTGDKLMDVMRQGQSLRTDEETLIAHANLMKALAEDEQELVTVDAIAWRAFIKEYDDYNECKPSVSFHQLRESLAIVIESAAQQPDQKG